MNMRMSSNGLNVTKYFETLVLETYTCAAGKLTIGYGHTGDDVKRGMVITESQADALLAEDMADAECEVNRLVKRPINQGQFDALCDFDFNKGGPALAGSTLLKKLNAGDDAGAAEEFLKWIYGGDGTKNGIDDDLDGLVDEPGEKQRLRGLMRRAHAQRALFLGHNGRQAVAIGVGAA